MKSREAWVVLMPGNQVNLTAELTAKGWQNPCTVVSKLDRLGAKAPEYIVKDARGDEIFVRAKHIIGRV